MDRMSAQDFLAGVHVGVLAVADGDRGPHLTPVWYQYEPGAQVRFGVAGTARKLTLLRDAGRASLLVQSETWPYRYVSVEGPIRIEDIPPGFATDTAQRYLGTEQGRRFVAANNAAQDAARPLGTTAVPGALIHLDPRRWRSADFAGDPLETAAGGVRRSPPR